MLQKIQSVGVANAPTGTTTNPIDKQRNLYFRGDDEQQDEFVSSEQEADGEKSSGAGKKWAIAGGVLAVVSAAAIGILHHKGAEAFGAEAGEKGFWEKVSKGWDKVFGKAEKTVENKGNEVTEDADKIVSKPGTPDHTAEIFENMFGKQYSEEMRMLGSKAVSKRLELNAEEEELARLKKVVTEAKDAKKSDDVIKQAQSEVDEQQKVVNKLKEEADKADEAFLSKMTKKEFEEFKKLVVKRKEQRAKLEKEIESMTLDNAKKAMDDAKAECDKVKKEFLDELKNYKDKDIPDDILASGDISKIFEEAKGKIGEENMNKLNELNKKYEEALAKSIKAEERNTLITKMNEDGFDTLYNNTKAKEIDTPLKDLLQEQKEIKDYLKNSEQITKDAKETILDDGTKNLYEAFEHRADVTKDGKIITVEEAQTAVNKAEAKVKDAQTKFDELNTQVQNKKFNTDQLEAIGKAEKYTDLGEKNLFSSDKEFGDFKKILADRKTAKETLTKAKKDKTTAEANVGYATILNKPDALSAGQILKNTIRRTEEGLRSEKVMELTGINAKIADSRQTLIESLGGETAQIIKAGLLKDKKTAMETGLKRGKEIETMQDAWVKKLEEKFGKTESK